MQVSSFNNRTRKAGNLEDASASKDFGARLTRAETDRHESVYDDLFDNSNRDSRTGMIRVKSAYSKFSSDVDDENSEVDPVDLNAKPRYSNKEPLRRVDYNRQISYDDGDEANDSDYRPSTAYNKRNFKPDSSIKMKTKKNINNEEEESNQQYNHFLVKSLRSDKKKPIESFESTITDKNFDAEIHPDKKKYDAFVTKREKGNNNNNNQSSPVDDDEEEDDDIENLENDFGLDYFKSVKSNTVIDFITTPPPEDILIRCKLKVHSGLFTEYTFFLENYEGRDLALMTTKQKKVSKGPNFTINALSIDGKSSKSEKEHIKFGKIFSNFSRSDYVLLGNQVDKDSDDESDFEEENDKQNHEKSDTKSRNGDHNEIPNKNKFFDLHYNNKLIGKSKPKDIVLNLNLHHLDQRELNTMKSHSSISSMFRKSVKKFVILTKNPEFDQQTKTYRLDFKGRAKLPSTNNLQMTNSDDSKKVILQIGKYENKIYNVDFAYPFTAFTAFAFAISCLTRN